MAGAQATQAAAKAGVHLNVRVRRDADGDVGGHGHRQRIPAFASHGESSHGRAGHDRGTRLRAADLLRDTERTGTGSSRWSSRTSKRARSAHPEAGRADKAVGPPGAPWDGGACRIGSVEFPMKVALTQAVPTLSVAVGHTRYGVRRTRGWCRPSIGRDEASGVGTDGPRTGTEPPLPPAHLPVVKQCPAPITLRKERGWMAGATTRLIATGSRSAREVCCV